MRRDRERERQRQRQRDREREKKRRREKTVDKGHWGFPLCRIRKDTRSR